MLLPPQCWARQVTQQSFVCGSYLLRVLPHLTQQQQQHARRLLDRLQTLLLLLMLLTLALHSQCSAYCVAARQQQEVPRVCCGLWPAVLLARVAAALGYAAAAAAAACEMFHA
jgi:hypothetical protein